MGYEMTAVDGYGLSMTLGEYQRRAALTDCYPDNEMGDVACLLGMTSEAGELAGKASKRMRGDTGVTERDEILEAGDVLWQLASYCRRRGWSMEMVARANLDKLASRQQRGVVRGDGDGR